MKPSIDGLKEKIEERDALLPGGGRDRQTALGESLPHLAPGPEAALAPKDRRTDGLFGFVVRRLDALHLDEGPEVLPQPVQFERERLCLGIPAVLGHVQHLGVTGLDQAHSQARGIPAQFAPPVLAMQFEQALRLGHAPGTHGLRSGMLPFGDGAPVPQEMRMADSPVFERGIGSPAVADDHAGIAVRENGSPRFMSSASVQLEDRGLSAADHPEPGFLPLVPPARLVGMHHGLGEHGLGDLLEGRFEGLSGLLAEGLDAAHGETEAECLAQNGAEFSSGEAIATAEHGDERRQARTEMTSPDPCRKFRAGGLAAALADASVQLVLDHHGLDGRDIRDLMADGLADDGLITGEIGMAVLAGAGKMRDDAVRIVDHGPVGPLMSRLSTRLSAAGLLGGGLRGSRRIGRRRRAGVGRVAVETRLQILDTRQQNSHRLLQRRDCFLQRRNLHPVRDDTDVALRDDLFKFGDTQVARIGAHASDWSMRKIPCREGAATLPPERLPSR